MKRRTARRSRKQRGGVKLRDLVFHYTTDPGRIAWVKATYNMGPAFLRMIETIPWSSYRYEGPTQIGFLNKETGELESVEERNVTATCFNVPYCVFGGASCEVYNLHYTEPGTPRLHETTDPTGDIDSILQPLVVQPEFTNEDRQRLKFFTRNKEGEVQDTIVNSELYYYAIKHEGGYSSLYNDYTRWIFEHVCQKVDLLQEQASGPLFAPKQREGDAETESADIYRQIGNFLVTRSTTGPLVKIQIGLAVKYGGNIKGDHLVELILDSPLEIDSLVRKQNPSADLLANRIEQISSELPFGLFVKTVESSITDQSEAYASRAKDALTQTQGDKDALLNYRAKLGHKYLNHYGRLIYLLKLLKYLNEKNRTMFKGNFYSITSKILNSKPIREAPVSMCWPTCDFGMIQTLMREITQYRPPRASQAVSTAAGTGPAAAGSGSTTTGASRKTRKRIRRAQAVYR